jgi:uncharacterized protein
VSICSWYSIRNQSRHSNVEALMIRIAAVSDLHFKPLDVGSVRSRLQGVNDAADLLLLPGDLIDSGKPEDARLFVQELSDISIPIIGVLGNHEYSSLRADEVAEIYRAAGITMLDGSTTDRIIRGESLGIVGTKGARGGFGQHLLEPTGEPAVDMWVYEAQKEAAKIEEGLGKLITDYRLVVLHLSPLRATVEGEAPEEIPFYGSSLMCEPIDRLGADLVVHGHSHKGTHIGTTPTGIPVYNVARTVIPAPYVILEMNR